jgi:Leucine-rich repeat (LRR) protein
MADIEYEQGRYGRQATVKTQTSPALIAELKSNELEALYLNDALGWSGDLSFLSGLPHLKSLRLLALAKESFGGTLEPIHSLHELRALEVFTRCRSEIRFAEFPQLQNCGIEWRPNTESIFETHGLKELFINLYPGTTSTPFARLDRLEDLALLGAKLKEIEAFAHLQELKRLRLGDLRGLDSLTGIETLSGLEELDLNTCRRISSLEPLAGLQNLKRLCLINMGDIASLAPLAHLKNLEAIYFYDSTNIVDGDLSPLEGLPKLRDIAFMPRRHYSHRKEDFSWKSSMT